MFKKNYVCYIVVVFACCNWFVRLFFSFILAVAMPFQNNTNSSDPISGDNFNWTSSKPPWNESEPSPIPPSQTGVSEGKQGCREQYVFLHSPVLDV